MAKDIYLVAHGEARHHVEGLVGGWYDSDLTELGQRQAQAVASRIAELVGEAPVEIYSSDLRRAAQTAAPIAQALRAKVTHWSDLRERSYGVAGGRAPRRMAGRAFRSRAGRRPARPPGRVG